MMSNARVDLPEPGAPNNTIRMIDTVLSAPDAVKAAARYLAPPVLEEGAAQMIERIALDGRG